MIILGDIRGKCGIYAIRNPFDAKVYVGKSKDIFRRRGQYIYDFANRQKGHLNDYLANAMAKYGIENFTISVLEECDISKLAERELFWILELRSTDRRFGYNLRLDSSTGCIVQKETAEKQRRNLMTQWANGVRTGHAEKMRLNWRNNPMRSEQQSDVMRRTLTKYEYVLIDHLGRVTKCDFRGLVAVGLKSAMSAFSRGDSCSAVVNGVWVSRRRVGADA